MGKKRLTADTATKKSICSLAAFFFLLRMCRKIYHKARQNFLDWKGGIKIGTQGSPQQGNNLRSS